MTLRASIATALRTVIGSTDGFGEAWTYQALTSAPGVEARTYGTLTAITGHQSNRVHSEAFQDNRGVWVRQERCGFRVSDAATQLKQGDQLKDPDGIYWAVTGILSSGVGTRRYDLARDVPLYAEPNRGGGL